MTTSPLTEDAGTPSSSTNDAVSYVDIVYDWVHAAISDLHLPAGSPLRENRLASHLGVSRTPVREALHRLERDGLVQRSPDDRFVVASLTVQDVDEACDAIQVLDRYLLERAVGRIDASRAEELRGIAAEMRRCSRDGDLTAWAEADHRFHDILAEAADNRLVSDLVSQVRRRVHRFWLGQEARMDGLSRCSQEHTELADAIAGGEVDPIGPVVERHIASMRANLLGFIQNVAPFLGKADWPPPSH
jgi:DNA-binding GntR family transcriptional regulator